MSKWRWMAFSIILTGSVMVAIRQMPPPLVDHNYVDALAAANRLLSAWQEKNGLAGLALMSPGLRRRVSDAELGQWIIGNDPSVSRSYEIGQGRRLTESRYQFQVRLLERSTGRRWGRARREGIVLTRNVRGRWMGETLPWGPGDPKLGSVLGQDRADFANKAR